jgi:hypothetical protein
MIPNYPFFTQRGFYHDPTRGLTAPQASVSLLHEVTYYDPTKSKTTTAESLKAVAKFILIVSAISMLAFFWNALEESNWMFHDRMTTVQGKGWQTGEYKFCVSVTRQELKYPLLLDCDKSWEHDPKFFQVRFWGPIQKNEKDATITLHWKCKKNGEGEPVITCEAQDQQGQQE